MRLGDDARKCVVFFGCPDISGDIKYRGTGFLTVYLDADGRHTRYLVTAKHVASKFTQGDLIRMNLVAGGARNWEMEEMRWVYHPSADIAVAPFSWGREYDVGPFNLSYGLTEQRRIDKRIECGDLAYIVGLFRLHSGSKKNVPIVHTGHIAAGPDDTELVTLTDRVTRKKYSTVAYLIEAQTLDGLSGSPVFVRRGVKAHAAEDGTINPLGYGAVFLLGVYLGSWEGDADETLAKDRDIDTNKVRVPVGMGTVAPFDQIIQVIEGEELSELRRQARDSAASGAELMSDFVLEVEVSNVSLPYLRSKPNPSHREDFTRLVDAAGKKKPQDE
jgi:hypothetical protein